MLQAKIFELMHKYKKADSNCVVLIACWMKPRVAKIGYAIRQKGYRVILFLEQQNSKEINKFNYKFYDDIYIFQSEEDIYCNCLKLKPLVYHLFTEANVSGWAEYLISRKDNLGKIVYDQYDVYRGLSRIHNRSIQKREKYCFENADGICCRSFETQYLKYRFHYHFNGKRILFLDYCWNKYTFARKAKKTDEGLQIVYGGRIVPPYSQDILGRTEWEALCFIAESLKRKKGCLTVIPLELNETHEDFVKLAEKNPFFKLKKPMKFQALIKYESNMDYGIDCLEFQNKMDEYEKIFAGTTDYRAKAKYYATNKFFDYIDAGIPILYGKKNEMFGRCFARYGAAIPCAVEDMPDMLDELKANRDQYAENVKVARETLSIEKQINRLIEFYKSL